MAAPVYSTDLIDITLAESTTDGGTWTAIGGGNITLGSGPDFSMQGTNCVDGRISNTDKGPGVSVGTISLGANDHIFGWVFLATPGLTATLQNGGVCIAVGTSVSALVKFHVEGNDTYGAAGRVAKCYPVRYVNTSKTTGPNYRTLLGSPGATPSFVGATTSISGSVRGSNIGVDAFRKGTGIYVTAGDSGTPANFTGVSTENDSINNRWGILTKLGGAFELQGRLVIGQNTSGTPTAAYFSASNQTVSFVDTPHSLTDFTQIIIDHASTVFNLTAVSMVALGTNNPGRLVFNNASTTSTLDSCTFSNMGISTLRAGVTATGCTWRACGQITPNGATITGCSIRNSTASSALLAGSSVSNLSDTSFVSSGTGHAIEITGGTTHTLNGITFSGYAATNGSTGNEAVYVNISSGNVTINADSALSYRTAGANVTVVAGQKTLSVTNVISGSDVVIKSSGTTTKLLDDQDITGSSSQYSYTYSAGTFVDIAVYREGYVPYFVNNFELPAEGGTVQVSQQADRNYIP